MAHRNWNKFESEGEFNLETAISHWHSTKIDPYLVWAFATNFAHLSLPDDNNLVPIIIELNPESDCGNAPSFASACAGLGFIDIPKIYNNILWPYDDIKYLTAVVHLSEFLTALNDGNTVLQSIHRFQIGLPVKTHIEPNLFMSIRQFNIHDRDSHKLSQQKTIERVDKPVVGIIDDGIGFLNEAFCDSNGLSRVRYFWNQNEDPSVPQSLTNSAMQIPVEYFEYGYELNHTEIDAIRQKLDTNNQASSEAVCYRSINYHSVSEHASHGTHMLDCAAGLSGEADSDIWNDTAIIAVQVQRDSKLSSDTSGRWLGVRMLDGIRYILERANRLPDNTDSGIHNVLSQINLGFEDGVRQVVFRPVLINISYGNIAGPHNGTSILEQAIDELVEKHAPTRFPLSVFVSAGNHKQAKCHACVNVLPNKTEELCWRVYPDDRTPSFMELWLPETAHGFDESSLEIAVCAPGEKIDEAQSIKIEESWSLRNSLDHPECVVVGLSGNNNAAGDRGMFVIALAPTFGTQSMSATPGVWKVILSNKGSDACEVNAWVERDDHTVATTISGRQSHFEDANHDHLNLHGYPLLSDVIDNGYIRVDGTMNGIATGEHTNTVASKTIADDQITFYSGTGTDAASSGSADRQFSVKEHSMTMASDDSNEIPGTIASGSVSGSKVVMSGTSVACALATRAEVKKLRSTSPVDSNTGTRLPEADINGPLRRGKAKML